MDYELSDAHKLIRDTARRIAREKVAPRSAELDESGEYPEDLFQVFAEAGLESVTGELVDEPKEVSPEELEKLSPFRDVIEGLDLEDFGKKA